jgi:hypothetical protein
MNAVEREKNTDNSKDNKEGIWRSNTLRIERISID